MKSTVDQIRARFDADVERFSNLETGQSAAMDSPLCLQLIAEAAAAVTPAAEDVLDIGCGAGNYTLQLLAQYAAARGGAVPAIHCTLLDLSRPMLDRAVARVSARTRVVVRPVQGDMRAVDLGREAFDVIVTAATFHHLRTPDEWQALYAKCFAALRPGGSFWIFDMVEHAHLAVDALMRRRYGAYLAALQGGGAAGAAYRDKVFAYIAAEDTPTTLIHQLTLMQQVGFAHIDVLHKNPMGAAFGGQRI